MIKPVIATVIVSLISVEMYAQTSYFTFGKKRMDRGKLIHYASPTSIFIAGESEDEITGEKAIFLSNLTNEGKTNWTKTYSGSISYAINDWVVLPGGGFVVSAEQYYKKDRETLYLMRLDNTGNMLWSNLFNEGGNEVEGLSIAATQDGGFIVTGLIKQASIISDVFFSMRKEKEYVYVLKIDSKGNKQWSKKFNYEQNAVAKGYKVVETIDGYVIGGSIEEKPDVKGAEILILKITKKGDFMWAKTLGGTKGEYIKNMLVVDNDLFVIGATTSFGVSGVEAYCMRLTTSGNLKWFKTYGGDKNENLSTIRKIDERTLVLAGETTSFGKGSYDALFLTTTYDGDILTAETFGNDKIESLGSAIISGNRMYATGFSYASSTPKSTQAYMLISPLLNKNETHFVKANATKTQVHTAEIVVKELTKNLLTNVIPVTERVAPPVLKTVIKSETMETESFIK